MKDSIAQIGRSRFTTRDLAFIGVISSLMFVSGFLLVWLGHTLVLGPGAFPGAPLLTQGPVYALLVVIAAAKVRKVGTIALVGTIVGILKLIVGAPIFVVIPFAIGMIAADIFVWLIRHDYCCRWCVLPAGGIMNTLPVPLLFGFLSLLGLPLTEVVKAHPWIAVGITAACLPLGILGSWLGFKMVAELKKAGVVE